MTLTVNLISRDCIVVGADTRTTSLNPDGSVHEYIDSTCKVIEGDSVVLTSAGQNMVDKDMSVREWLMIILACTSDRRDLPSEILRESKYCPKLLQDGGCTISIAYYFDGIPYVYTVYTERSAIKLRRAGTTYGAAFAGQSDIAFAIMDGIDYGDLDLSQSLSITRNALISTIRSFSYRKRKTVGGSLNMSFLLPNGGVHIAPAMFLRIGSLGES